VTLSGPCRGSGSFHRGPAPTDHTIAPKEGTNGLGLASKCFLLRRHDRCAAIHIDSAVHKSGGSPDSAVWGDKPGEIIE
jgi:hypothetical protein